MPTELSSSKLLELCLRGTSEDAWLEFIRRYRPVIVGNVSRVAAQHGINNSAVIEDIIQDMYIKLCDGNCQILREFRNDGQDGLYAFPKVVSANVARDRCQAMGAVKRGGGKVVSLSDSESMPADDEFGSRLEKHLFMGKVAAALGRCATSSSAARDENIFWLFYRQQLTAKEIAGIPVFELTAKGVESALRRLVRCIRSMVARTANR